MLGVSAAAALRLEVQAEAGVEDWVHALRWRPGSDAVVVAGADGAVTQVDLAGRAELLTRHDGPATCLAIAPDGTVASGGHDRCVLVGERRVALGGPWVERVAWRPDGARLAVAAGRRVHLLARDGEPDAASPPAQATVSCLAWHPRGVLVAAGSYGGVRMLRGRDGGLEADLAWTGSVLELALSPDGRRLAHGNQDATVHFWELAKRRELHMWGYETKVRHLSWRRDGRLLATAGGRSVTVWDFAGRGPEGSKPAELDEHVGPVSALAFAPTCDLLASGGVDGLLLVWHPERDDAPLGGLVLDEPVSAVDWSPDGTRLAAATAQGKVVVAALRAAP